MSTPPSRRTDADECAALVHRHARTFHAASRFLNAEKRRAAFAVYAFCRVADDIVDEADAGGEAKAALERQQEALAATFRGVAQGPLFRELAWAVHRFGIPDTPFHALVDALRGDLAPREVATYEDLAHYCGGVASTVGEMCAYVFGLPSPPPERAQALRHARTLGIALQLTNILRDVGEDSERGRCYIPTSDLLAFGIARREVLDRTIRAQDSRWVELMRHEIGRARALYAAADPGLRMLAPDARCCAMICSRGYAAILAAIERRRFDSLAGRARVGSLRKGAIMLDAWCTTSFLGGGVRRTREHLTGPMPEVG